MDILKEYKVMYSPHRIEDSSDNEDSVITVIPKITDVYNVVKIIGNVTVYTPVISDPIIERY